MTNCHYIVTYVISQKESFQPQYSCRCPTYLVLSDQDGVRYWQQSDQCAVLKEFDDFWFISQTPEKHQHNVTWRQGNNGNNVFQWLALYSKWEVKNSTKKITKLWWLTVVTETEWYKQTKCTHISHAKSLCVFVCVRACVRAWVRACIRDVCVRVCECMRACMCVCVCACVRVRACVLTWGEMKQ